MGRGLTDGQRAALLLPSHARGALKRKFCRTRRGKNVIRDILCQCGHAARLTKSSLASKSKCLRVRKSHKKVAVAVARKVTRLICILLSRREPHLEQATDGAARLARKNAPRWIKPLTAIGKCIRECIGKHIGEWPANSAPAATAAT